MPAKVALLFHRPIDVAVQRRGSDLLIRTYIRELPGLLVLMACLCLLLPGGIVALRQGNIGGWVALGLATLVAYPLARRLGGGSGAIRVSADRISQRIHFKRRQIRWREVAQIQDDLAGHVSVLSRSGESVEFVSLGLPPVAWGYQLTEWWEDLDLLSEANLNEELEKVRRHARAFSLK